MRINSNVQALTAVRYYEYHQQRAARCIGRIAGGKRINSAADDPAGMVIAEKLRTRLRELSKHIRNAEMRQDSLNTAYSDTVQRQNMLGRLSELSIRLSSDTLTSGEKQGLSMEFSALIEEMYGTTLQRTGMEIVAVSSGCEPAKLMFKHGDKIYSEGKWTSLSDYMKSLSLDDDMQTLEGRPIDTGMELSGLSDKLTDIKPQEPETKNLVDYVKCLMRDNLSTATGISALASGISFALERLYTEEENAMAALSRIEDADIAKEISELMKERVLGQCALLMAAQANAMPERVLYLLENVHKT